MTVRTLAFALLLGAAGPAMAQTGAPAPAAPTVEQYLCTFAGKCGADATPADSVTRQAPETRGFRIARPSADTKPAAAAPAPAMGHARPGTIRSRAPRATYAAAAAAPAAGAMAPAHMGTPGARPRADLMIGFELNSDRLSPEGVSAARTFARSLQMPELAGKRFLIEGHTDLRGGRALNAGLSARRAQAVADFLVGEGVDRGRLQARGFGSASPLPGHRVTDPANRRVEAELIS